ncbi:hypothetical protein A2954_04725 [Candidatus Roizmanbacteria bacterium RIFCSPLOWO2_01_FULL_37_12]|uniref:Transcription factor zinc-finger domain-containing protein n=1 Tax=Candidatus Roizmanbacteria bacterium RIFCSPLOWO2_01_FULL_37_12 TaxID=1802056 RepID=A0A1F7IG06_9BACT|nr:MAG: hypothetical protein A2768_00910 [Candidatus Roizmanbacteria bacterium RIFCSPHIGHO2_01_FULL_37_16]OGK24997.1 MAG: hypothetical protein A3D76_03860 [Candidatus Roizmanbacteria bacterium RIFCSPHIGHO2_02_FULL_37_9b]OGK42283.1 MAG: hypothetical protein A2954_04725 [Candidatus Roizmanbacteria bacterium RIFCSPLOWO2_01_FULL_37_12]
MLCPNCKEKFNSDVVDGQNILHCSNCGGTFFQENGINRISVQSAQNLASDLKTNDISNAEKLCPRDQTLLVPFRSEESVPADVTLLYCATCKGIFTQANDLLIFKKAQAAKIDYFKLWNIPLPSIKSIAVLSVMLFVSVLSLTVYTYFQRQNIYFIQASDQIKNIYITSANRYLFISFKTVLPLRSHIVFTDVTTNQTVEKILSSKPATLHLLTTGDINIDDEIYYQIVLTDVNGAETKTEIKRLELK